MSVTSAVGLLIVVHFALFLVVPGVYLFRHRGGYIHPGIALAAFMLSEIIQGTWTAALIVPAFLAGGLVPGLGLYVFAVTWVLAGAVVCYPLLVYVLGVFRARVE